MIKNTKSTLTTLPANEKQWYLPETDRQKYVPTIIRDHRINYTIYNLAAFMDGDIQDCIDHLTVAENAERLKESEL